METGFRSMRPAVRGYGRTIALAGAALLSTLAVLPADAQEQRHRTQPILRPWADAPTAVVRQLVFSDGAEGTLWLYAAGDEKFVRRWRFEERGDEPAGLVEDATPIVWPIYRDIRGVIYALDAQRDPATGDQRLAIGGFGQQKSSQVNVLLASRPELAEVLIDPRYYQPVNKVVSLDLDPKGALLAVGLASSPEVLLWDVASPPGRDSRQAKKRLATGLAEVSLVAFNPAGNLLAVAGTGQDKRRVQVWNVARGAKVSESVLTGRAQGLTWRDDTTWLVGTAVQDLVNGAWVVPADSGLIQGRAGETKTSIVLSGRFVRQVTAVPGTSQFVLSVVDDVVAQRGRVVRWSPGDKLEPFDNGVFDDLVTALCVSPDGRLVAATGTARIGGSQVPVYQVRVWRIGGELAAQVPDADNALTVGGPIGNVAVLPGKLNAESGKKAPESVAFAFGRFVKNQRHVPLARKFRLLARAEGALASLAPDDRPLVAESDHLLSEVFRTSDGRGLFQLGSGDDSLFLPTETEANVPYCYAFGRVRHGNGTRDVLAVGYVLGIRVFDLDAVRAVQPELRNHTAGVPADRHISTLPRSALDQLYRTIVRSFYGHSAPVTSLGFSDDGEWLVSGSMDGTICGWSLKGIANRRELGVEFQIDARTRFLTVVRDPRIDSPGWEAGFRARQVVRTVEEDGRIVAPAQWKAKLENPIPGRELTVEIQHLTAALKTHVSHDPLWTLYPYQDGEWLLWTPQGTFDCSLGAARRAKWHVNLNGAVDAVVGAEVGALLFDLETFAPQYRVTFKRDQLSQVISTRRPDPPTAEYTLPLTLRNLASTPASEAGQRLVTIEALLPSSQFAVTAFELMLNADHHARGGPPAGQLPQ
jgi:WD40 repeat protein